MSNIVDFKKAKQASDKRKEEKLKREKKNTKLIKKYKRIDKGKSINVIYFYMALLFFVTIFVLWRIF